jgi:hypothetical protein
VASELKTSIHNVLRRRDQSKRIHVARETATIFPVHSGFITLPLSDFHHADPTDVRFDVSRSRPRPQHGTSGRFVLGAATVCNTLTFFVIAWRNSRITPSEASNPSLVVKQNQTLALGPYPVESDGMGWNDGFGGAAHPGDCPRVTSKRHIVQMKVGHLLC